MYQCQKVPETRRVISIHIVQNHNNLTNLEGYFSSKRIKFVGWILELVDLVRNTSM